MQTQIYFLLFSFFFLKDATGQQHNDAPDARGRAHLIYHPASKAMLLFDGYLNHPDSTRNNVWKWDGNKWEEIVAYGPGSRIVNAAALNNKTGDIEFFAGWGKEAINDKKNDLWSFDGMAWKKLTADTIGTRDHHKMIYMDHMDAFLVYGGFDFNFKNDTATWLLKDGHFTVIPGKSPGACGNFALTYDPYRKRAILFSRNFLHSDKPADLWEFDGNKWEEIKVPDIGVTSTYNMVYNNDLKMAIVQNAKGETWGWDGRKMTKIAEGGPAEFGVALGYDPVRKVIGAYGGYGPQRTAVSSLWELQNGKWKKIVDNGRWKQVSINKYEKLDPSADITIPGERWAHQMTYDEANNKTLLFGGSHGNKILGDLWAWNGSAWEELTLGGPPPLSKGIFVYDATRKVSVLFSGADSRDENSGDTWEWDGRDWKEIKSKGPPARVHGLGAYDYKNKNVLIFGGFGSSGALDDTWTFDGKEWKLVNANGPKDCLPHGMIYDETRKVIVMITVMLNTDAATGKPNNEMWEWTGKDWRKLPGIVPSITGLQAFASFGNEAIILYDGNDGATWKYSSGKWNKITGSGPGIRMGHVMVYDKKRKRIVLFGGGKADTAIRYNDTWEWDGKEWRRIK